MPLVKKLIATLFINPCVHAIKHDLYSKDAAKRHKCQVKIKFSHVCYIWLFRRSRFLISRQISSSRMHLRRSFLWKSSFCIISLAFVCTLVRWLDWRGLAHAQRDRLVQFIFTLSRSPWMVKGPAEKTRMNSQHALGLLALVWCRFSWLFPVLACVQLVWRLFWSLFSWSGHLKPAEISTLSGSTSFIISPKFSDLSLSLHDHRRASLTVSPGHCQSETWRTETPNCIYKRVTIQSLLALLSKPLLDLVKGDYKQIKLL